MTAINPQSEEVQKYLSEKRIANLLDYILRAVSRDTPENPTEYIHQLTSTPFPPHIVIAGPPAGGKGTQCANILAYYEKETGRQPVHISSGDILRVQVKEGTDLGIQAEKFMKAGKLVPDELISNMMIHRLSEPDCVERGWILDGFPRNREQAETLDKAGVVPDVLLLLEVPDEVLFERVTGRRTDPVTGNIYHLTFNPPPADDAELLARLEQRADDTPDVLKPRLETYHSCVAGISDFYSAITERVNSNQSSDVVGQDVAAVLSKYRIRIKKLGPKKKKKEVVHT
ncbi:adenylate kinase [Angomonas deanei]|nr:adenylate kinase [Angomonas deanei]|eukprot:EPY32493.1 adenylate kinase [Angomonas deanei]